MLPLNSPPGKLCIVRLSALGDVTHAVPVLRAIQAAWPQTEITWICASVEHRLLAVLEGVRFVIIDKKSGWRGYRKIRRELAGEYFDVMIQMQVSARANLAGACVKAGIKLGWDKARSRDFHQWFMTDAIPPVRQQHQAQAHLEFARTLGLDADEPVWDFPVTSEAAKFAADTLPGAQKTLLVSPCSSHTHRNWITERYAAVADYAVENHGMRIVLTGGPSEAERNLGAAIERAMLHPVNNLVGQVSLDQLVALLQRASLVLSPDSGPAHIANALATPVIGLHACTWSIRGGPYNYLDLCVDKFPEAAYRFRNCKPEDIRWGTKIEQPGVMELIQTHEVIERLNAAVERL